MSVWAETCAHDREGFYGGLAPQSPGVVAVVVVCHRCRRLGAAEVAYPAPTFGGRPVGAG